MLYWKYGRRNGLEILEKDIWLGCLLINGQNSFKNEIPGIFEKAKAQGYREYKREIMDT